MESPRSHYDFNRPDGGITLRDLMQQINQFEKETQESAAIDLTPPSIQQQVRFNHPPNSAPILRVETANLGGGTDETIFDVGSHFSEPDEEVEHLLDMPIPSEGEEQVDIRKNIGNKVSYEALSKYKFRTKSESSVQSGSESEASVRVSREIWSFRQFPPRNPPSTTTIPPNPPSAA